MEEFDDMIDVEQAKEQLDAYIDKMIKARDARKRNSYIEFYVYPSDRLDYLSGHSVGLKFFIGNVEIFNYQSGLSRRTFFEIFKSSELIDEQYLPIGGCDACDDFGCSEFVTKYTKQDNIITLENIYSMGWDEENSYKKIPNIVQSFYFEIEEETLLSNINKLKDDVI